MPFPRAQMYAPAVAIAIAVGIGAVLHYPAKLALKVLKTAEGWGLL